MRTIEDIEENQIDDFYKLIGSNVKKMRNKILYGLAGFNKKRTTCFN